VLTQTLSGIRGPTQRLLHRELRANAVFRASRGIFASSLPTAWLIDISFAISVPASAVTQLIFAANGHMQICTPSRRHIWLIQHGQFFA
jgi:hypothetical protein